MKKVNYKNPRKYKNTGNFNISNLLKDLKYLTDFKSSKLYSLNDLIKDEEFAKFIILNIINLKFIEVKTNNLKFPFWNLMFLEFPVEVFSGYRNNKIEKDYLLIGGENFISIMESYLLEADYDESDYYSYGLNNSKIESSFAIRRKFHLFLINLLFKHRLGLEYEIPLKNYSDDLTIRFNRKNYGVQKLN